MDIALFLCIMISFAKTALISLITSMHFLNVCYSMDHDSVSDCTVDTNYGTVNML